MAKDRKQRLKSPKIVNFPKQAPKRNYFSTLMSTPEGRELRKQWSNKPKKNAGRPKGVPDGHTAKTIKPLREKVKKEAIMATEIIAEKYDIQDEYSKEALQTAVEVMRLDGETRERLAAARLVLDFTKSKPATKSDVTIGKAEDFLASLLVQEEEQNESEAITDTKATS